MPLIGDELRTILGMMPTRDRAGIARGTMADDAMRSSAAAEGGNAEGAALMQQGQRPPQIQLPPQMRGGPDGGDIRLPDDVGAEYASGRSSKAPPTSLPVSIPGVGPAVPVPQERVIASSPAAAPTPTVATRASDIMLATIAQQQRQQKMMQLVGSLGLIANAFNRNPSSQASTRTSLAEMIGGGAGGHGGNALNEIKTISDMRAAEDAAIQAAKDKEGIIQHGMRTQNLTRADAETLYATGALNDRTKPEAMLKAEDIRNKERQKVRLRAMAPEIAARNGADVKDVLNRIESNPDEVEKTLEPGARETVRGQRADNTKKETEQTLLDQDITNYVEHVKNPQALKDAYPDEDPARIDIALRSHSQYKKLMEELTTKGQTGTMDPGLKDLIDKQINPARAKAHEAAMNNQSSNREMQNLWRKDLRVGSPYTSELMFNISKGWANLTNQKVPERTLVTERMMQQQVEGTLATLKQLGAGTGLSNADREYAAKAQGGFGTTADTLKYLLYAQEKLNNFRIAQHNAEIDRFGTDSRYIKNRERTYKVDYPEPNRFMREAVRERKLDTLVETAVREGNESDPAIRAAVETGPRGVGPGVFDHLVREERARQGKK
jgi:hypothetical protein